MSGLSALSHSLYFAGRFLRSPGRIGSILPSSRGLRERMFEGLCPDTGGPLLEFGPGTGAFTVKVDGWRRKGIRVPYLGIERDRGLYERLVRRFPGLDFVLGDVVDAADICAERRFPPAAAVISGLPLILMSQSALAAVLDNTRHCMAPLGVFRAFSYLHCYRTQRASRLRHHLAELFEDSRAITRAADRPHARATACAHTPPRSRRRRSPV